MLKDPLTMPRKSYFETKKTAFSGSDTTNPEIRALTASFTYM